MINIAYAAKDNVEGIITYFNGLIGNFVIPFLITLAVLGFVYGVVKFYMNPDNEEGRKKGKEFIIWGLIAMFVIVAMWGLVRIIGNTFIDDFKLDKPSITPNGQSD
ncbi:TPA: hypothetical protein DIC38_02150 [Candidatus Nomurabacteria bacterium]|nr:MAG: hypothetical protein O210_OD1C00001G0300 [Parcubacteria bacterium RAAC4_OD1_1]HCY26459.1 hypothetical protein [Candidatus Nomurabacteria bacterium]